MAPGSFQFKNALTLSFLAASFCIGCGKTTPYSHPTPQAPEVTQNTPLPGGGQAQVTPTPVTRTSPQAGIVHQEPDLHDLLGLQNFTGNICFLNSVHKLLWAHSKFANPALAKSINQRLLFNLLYKLDQNASHSSSGPAPHSNEALTEDTRNLIERLNRKRVQVDDVGVLLGTRQMDAYDYLRVLSNKLQLPQIGGGLIQTTQNSFENNTVFSTPQYEPSSLMLQLHIDHTNINTIQQAIHHFFEPTLLNDRNQAIHPTTGALEDALQRNYLAFDTDQPDTHPPDQIIIQLLRLKHDPVSGAVKLTKKVAPSKHIQLTFHAMNALTNPTAVPVPHITQQYRLKGIVIHVGNTGGGHYYTYLLHKNKKWYKHDDAHVTVVNTIQLTAAMKDDRDHNGYLFLYSATPQK